MFMCYIYYRVKETRMSNVLKAEKQEQVVAALAEGSSIRSIERMTGIHRDTIMRLGVRVGQGCTALMDETMRNLTCKTVQVDEIWGFIGKKQKRTSRAEDAMGYGDAWTFISIDADTKLVPSFAVGKRDATTANAFMRDLASRLKNRIQLSSDGMAAYIDAVERGFGGQVDYAQIVKSYEAEGRRFPEARYSPGEVVKVERFRVEGAPEWKKISTSYIERQNLTLRMHCRRLTRLTNAFSKKPENFMAAVGLSFAYYNFCRRHATLRATPCMAAGLTKDFWTVADLLKATA